MGSVMRTLVRLSALPLLGLLAGLAAAALATTMIPPTYEATGSVLIMPTTAESADLAMAQNLAPTVARLAQSREVALDVADTVGRPDGDVIGHLSGVSEPGIQIITVTATASTADGSVAMADAAAAALSRVCARLRLGGDAALSVLAFDRAGVPTAPVSPRPLLNYALGALVGLLAGLGLASLRSRVDDRFRRLADVEAELMLPALGVLRMLPRARVRRARTVYAQRDIGAAIDAMVATLTVLAGPQSPRRIIVTSVRDDGSATFVASLLALGLRRYHGAVTVIEGPQRRPTLQRHFGDQPLERSVEEALASRRAGPVASADQVTVIPFDTAGRYLGTDAANRDRLGGIVDAFAAVGDHVVTAVPSVLTGAGLPALARHADVVLLAVPSDWVRKGEAGRAALLVQRLGVPLAGLVVLGSATDEDGSRASAWPSIDRPTVDRPGVDAPRPDRFLSPAGAIHGDDPARSEQLGPSSTVPAVRHRAGADH